MMKSNGYTEPPLHWPWESWSCLSLDRDTTLALRGDGETHYIRGRTDPEGMGSSAPLLETDVPVARTAGAHGGIGPVEQSLQDLQDSGQPQDIPDEFR